MNRHPGLHLQRAEPIYQSISTVQLTLLCTALGGETALRNGSYNKEHVPCAHLAPPCATYIRAKQAPIPQWKLDTEAILAHPKTGKDGFDARVWGSSRDEATSVLANSSGLEGPRPKCPRQKWEHEAWRVHLDNKGWKFPTEDDCEYPKLLCNEAARGIAVDIKVTTRPMPAKRNKRPNTVQPSRPSGPPSESRPDDANAQKRFPGGSR